MKQVEWGHYRFRKYVHKLRWASFWHQVDESMSFNPRKIVEVGPGPGIFKAVCTLMGAEVATVDIDPDLQPDYIAAATLLPFEDSSYDVACAFQVLEHLPFHESVRAFGELVRVAREAVVISLPDARTVWPVILHVPLVGRRSFMIPKPRLAPPAHIFNGEHYWEINKRGFPTSQVQAALLSVGGVSLLRTFRVPEHPYHRFMTFKVTKGAAS